MLRTTLQNLPRALPFFLAIFLSVLLFAPSWLSLVQQWLRFEQILAHGLPTFLLFLGLIAIHPPKGPLDGWGQTPKRGWPWLGMLALLAVAAGWALFELVNIDLLTFLALPASVGALVWVLLGFQALWRFIPYLIVLGLSLPFWGDLVDPLVQLASIVVGGLVGRMGMTALIEGSSITLPYGRLVIVDGCSGIRYFAISILLGSMIAILNDYRWRGWLIALSIGMALGLLANWIRITGLVIIGYQSEMQSSLMQEHELYGWLIYAAVCLPALYFAPVRKRSENTLSTRFRVNPKGYLGVALALLVGPVLVWFNSGALAPQPALVAQNLRAVEPSIVRQPSLALALPETLEQRHYWLAEHNAWLTLAQFQRMHSDEKLVPYIGPQFNSSLWQVRHDIAAHAANGPIRVYRNVNNQRQVALSQWYRVGPYQAADYTRAKLLQIPATFIKGNQFALLSLQTPCEAIGCEAGIARLQTAVDEVRLIAEPGDPLNQE
ncbi:MAG: exosortase/archaeosortase family protein [Saccharospirillum sp.]